ncbi:hypothetical protein BDZ88DRAFT_142020 [Geranomyces variabilis]|nr:hypothetical protein BDZ88DRAFT_142020 [Geranomyces variabilis]
MPARLSRLLLRPAARCRSRTPPFSSGPTSFRQLSQATTAAEAEADLITRLHLRVGRILAVEPHPAADKLFIETIDIGTKKESADEQGAVAQTPEPVTIVSGLRPYYEAQELENRDVVVAVNMKPTNFRGVRSAGMLLAAYKDDVVEVLEPPLGSSPGDLVFVAGVPKAAGGASYIKPKMFDAIKASLRTTDQCVATYKGEPLRTDRGLVSVKSLRGAPIS